MHDMADKVVATVRKNAREEIRVSIETFNGRRIVSVRTWFEAADGTMRPGKSGIGFGISHLLGVADALAQAVNAAKANGELP